MNKLPSSAIIASGLFAIVFGLLITMALHLAGVQGNTYTLAPPVFSIMMYFALLSTFNALNKIVSKGNTEHAEIKAEITI